jgi:hypothetical protein
MSSFEEAYRSVETSRINAIMPGNRKKYAERPDFSTKRENEPTDNQPCKESGFVRISVGIDYSHAYPVA